MTKKHELADKISNLVLSVLDDGPIERSRAFLPVSSIGTIAPGESAMITARPQLPFRGDRFAVWSLVAPSFLIEAITVVNRSLDVQCGTTPADVFATRLDLLPMLDQQLDAQGFVQVRVSRKAEECFGQPLAFPVTRPGCEVRVVVTNASERALRFVAVILGDVEHIPLPELR